VKQPRQRSRRSRPRRRLLLERCEDGIGEATRQPRPPLAGVRRRLDEMREADLGGRAPDERRLASLPSISSGAR